VDLVTETNSIVELYCPNCGYDLRGIDSARCPECGAEIDRSKFGESILPWLHRHQIGRFRAFWRTVRMATFRPKALAEEMSRPARFADAILFRRIVVLHAMITIAGPLTLVYLLNGLPGTGSDNLLWSSQDRLGSLLQLAAVPLGWACLAMFFFAITGVGSYFFHPKSISVVRQNRAVALSCYACAPLAYLPVTAILFAIATFVGTEMVRPSELLLSGMILLVGYAPLALQIIAMIRTPVILLGRTTHTETGRQAGLAIFLPLAWSVLGILLLVIVPAALMMLGLMVLSLRQ
jgi:hypothetical protein